MPSFIVHSIAGREIAKILNLTGKKRDYFFIANLLPDTNQVEKRDDLSDKDLRILIQKEKKITHFRTTTDGILSYPDIDYFLSKYKDKVKNDIVVLGYFFHLYTDYYYFHDFLPKLLTFLDKDGNEIYKKDDNDIIKINKTGKLIKKDDFWSKRNSIGIYSDYSRLNTYLIKKYNFPYDYNKCKSIIDSGEFSVPIAEINPSKIGDVLKELDNFYTEALNNNIEEFKIFNKEDIDNLISDVSNTFLEKYNSFIK